MLAPDEALLLDRLTLRDRASAVRPAAVGGRRASARGAGIDFQEYRRYQAGDDPRTIDWTVEARLRQLVVRVSRAEGNLRLHTVVDCSASMSVGSPSKLACAKRVAAALCYLAVEHRDAAGVVAFRDHVAAYLPPAQGKGQLFRAFELLRTQEPSGPSAIDAVLEQYAATAKRPGFVAVLSDYLEPGAGVRGLRCLLHQGLVPAVVQVLAPEEISPDFSDEMELVDIEHQHKGSLVVDAGMIAAYRARLARHEALLRGFCLTHGVPWVRVVSDMSFAGLLAELETNGVVGVHA
jgi:uncharacterized protein (DUF58 family)